MDSEGFGEDLGARGMTAQGAPAPDLPLGWVVPTGKPKGLVLTRAPSAKPTRFASCEARRMTDQNFCKIHPKWGHAQPRPKTATFTSKLTMKRTRQMTAPDLPLGWVVPTGNPKPKIDRTV